MNFQRAETYTEQMRTRNIGSTLAAIFLITGLFVFPGTATALTEPTPEPTVEPTPDPPKVIEVVTLPKITGTIRFRSKLTRSLGTYSETSGVTHKTQWLRNGAPISKATGSTYNLGVSDVGARISVRVTASKTGYTPAVASSAPTAAIKHVRDVRKTVNYRIATRGKTTTSKASFSKEVNKILNDPRGWRSDGIAFKEVKTGGSMTIYLAHAKSVRSFSSSCSAKWSCRVGRNVVINQDRWKHSTTTWKKAKGTTLSGYRHMVVNHEVGHWLGRGHSSCKGKGKTAPIMMQQSKGLKGCKPNPWPLTSELNPPRFR